MNDVHNVEKLVKSRQRVAAHGEVFTPAWLVNDMLNLVKAEVERIESRVLEPACGDGNFLVPVLERKLAVVQQRYSNSDFEYRHYALLALMGLYGIKLLPDNAADCRDNLLRVISTFIGTDDGSTVWIDAARVVLGLNIVQGDALTMLAHDGKPIVFPEWSYLGKGNYQRRDLKYQNLTAASSFGEDTLFADMGKHEIFQPIKTFPSLTANEIAGDVG